MDIATPILMYLVHNWFGIYKTMSVKTKVREALIAYVYDQTKIGLLTSLLCASLILAGLYPAEKNTILLPWYGFFLLVTLTRFMLSV